MSIQEKINEDFKNAMKNRDKDQLHVLRFVKAEFQRGEKIVSDEEAIKILKGIRKGAAEMQSHALTDENKKDIELLIDTVNSYLPKEMTADEVFIWVDKNMKAEDFENFGLAMKFAMANLPSGTNGKFVASAVKLLLR